MSNKIINIKTFKMKNFLKTITKTKFTFFPFTKTVETTQEIKKEEGLNLGRCIPVQKETYDDYKERGYDNTGVPVRMSYETFVSLEKRKLEYVRKMTGFKLAMGVCASEEMNRAYSLSLQGCKLSIPDFKYTAPVPPKPVKEERQNDCKTHSYWMPCNFRDLSKEIYKLTSSMKNLKLITVNKFVNISVAFTEVRQRNFSYFFCMQNELIVSMNYENSEVKEFFKRNDVTEIYYSSENDRIYFRIDLTIPAESGNLSRRATEEILVEKFFRDAQAKKNAKEVFLKFSEIIKEAMSKKRKELIGLEKQEAKKAKSERAKNKKENEAIKRDTIFLDLILSSMTFKVKEGKHEFEVSLIYKGKTYSKMIPKYYFNETSKRVALLRMYERFRRNEIN